MAYGRHWEWRGFGSLPQNTREQLAALPARFSKPEFITDNYLYVPGSSINIKLRSRGAASVKLKRFERSTPGGFELWVEPPEEEFLFPLSPETIRALAKALGVVLPDARIPLDRDALLKLLSQAPTPIQPVSVHKLRDTRVYRTRGGSVLVEVADIDQPETVTSISVEDEYELTVDSPNTRIEEALAAVREAVQKFGLDQQLRTMNYLEALRFWTETRSVTLEDQR